ncbi:MAG TPA: DinB family protein [Bryobacteraceae bacterium]|jgi:uncharacterized damage-inducible protein DinB|nr:DinB family protein [Bryobacteraceae bacterium]
MEKLAGVLDYGPQDMADSFRAIRKETVTIAEEIGEENYGFSPAAEWRTVAQLLVHMAMAPKVQQRFHSINQYDKTQAAELTRFMATVPGEEQTLRTKGQIVALLRENGEEFAQWLESRTPDFLDERVAVEPGKTRTRFEVLLRVKEHEIHHRAQLMLIERLVGIVPHTTRERGVRAAAARSQQASS